MDGISRGVLSIKYLHAGCLLCVALIFYKYCIFLRSCEDFQAECCDVKFSPKNKVFFQEKEFFGVCKRLLVLSGG